MIKIFWKNQKNLVLAISDRKLNWISSFLQFWPSEMCEKKKKKENVWIPPSPNIVAKTAGLPSGFLNGQISRIWPLWNCLPEIKWFGHLVIFRPFWMLKKIAPFKGLFRKKSEKIFYAIFKNVSFKHLTAKFSLLIF